MTGGAAPAAPNADQDAYWNDQGGRTWAELQVLLDTQIAPLGARGLQALAPAPGERVLDIGCGCGGSTLDIARLVGPAGSAIGIDLSEPMLEVARRRAAEAALPGLAFQRVDAQLARFTEPFDAAFSRFGVMFFNDAVAAFANIRAALRPGGRLAFVCWRQPEENPWLMEPLEAALKFVPLPPPSEQGATGPFAFADPARIHQVLSDAGFTDIVTEPFDSPVGGLDLQQALQLALRVGPLGKMLREAPEHAPRAVDAVRAVLVSHLSQREVWMGAGTWIVEAGSNTRRL